MLYKRCRGFLLWIEMLVFLVLNNQSEFVDFEWIQCSLFSSQPPFSSSFSFQEKGWFSSQVLWQSISTQRGQRWTSVGLFSFIWETICLRSYSKTHELISFFLSSFLSLSFPFSPNHRMLACWWCIGPTYFFFLIFAEMAPFTYNLILHIIFTVGKK